MRARTVALDCGSSRCVVGAFSPTADGELMLEDYALEPRAADSIGALVPALPEALRRGGRIALSPPANLTVSKTITIPAVAAKRRSEVLRFEAGQAIPRPLAEVVWDAAPALTGGAAMDLAAIRHEVVQAWCAAADGVGVRLEAVLPRANALLLAVYHNYPELRGALVVAEVEGATALLVWATEGASAVRLIALPETVPVAVLADGTAPEDGVGGMTVAGEGSGSTRVRRLAAEVSRLAEVDGGENRPLVLFLAGTDAPTCGELEGVVDELSVRVERLDPFRRVRLAKTASGAGALAHQFAVAVGVALAVQRGVCPNLLPTERRRENAFRRSRKWWLALFAATAVALWGTAWRLRVATASQEAEVHALEQSLVPWREAQARVRELQGELERGERELAVLATLERARGGWAKWLAGMQEQSAQAEGVWIETLRVEEAPPPNAGGGLFGHPGSSATAEPGLRVAVSGCALDPGLDGRRGLERVRGLLEGWAGLPGVGAVVAERFDTGEPGLLRFWCIVEMKPEGDL